MARKIVILWIGLLMVGGALYWRLICGFRAIKIRVRHVALEVLRGQVLVPVLKVSKSLALFGETTLGWLGRRGLCVGVLGGILVKNVAVPDGAPTVLVPVNYAGTDTGVSQSGVKLTEVVAVRGVSNGGWADAPAPNARFVLECVDARLHAIKSFDHHGVPL